MNPFIKCVSGSLHLPDNIKINKSEVSSSAGLRVQIGLPSPPRPLVSERTFSHFKLITAQKAKHVPAASSHLVSTERRAGHKSAVGGQESGRRVKRTVIPPYQHGATAPGHSTESAITKSINRNCQRHQGNIQTCNCLYCI